MTEAKTAHTSGFSNSDMTDMRTRNLTLNIVLTIGLLATAFFGISDAFRHRTFALFVSLFGVFLFALTLLLNIFVPRFRTIISVCFVAIVGIVFLTLLSTQFPDPAIVFWCFSFPLIALFLLGRNHGIVTLIMYNLGIICIFILDIRLQYAKYTYEYAIRYSGAMIVISVLAYYYESLRFHSLSCINAMNRSLEQRIEERTKALEETQERLQQAEKLEAIGLLAGGIAHDFNNQLTGIMAFADLIRIHADDHSEIRNYAEKILTSSRHSAEMTGQLLAFARKGKIFVVPVDMHNVVSDVISLLKHTVDKRIVLRQELIANQSTIRGDPAQMESALLNIALNACDAMPAGGELTFATDSVNLEEADCKNLPNDLLPGTYLRLSITDTGCGMDKKILNRIFEPFFTTKKQEQGTGMGLPAVYGTVMSHKGAITVSSEPGQGTSFQMYFPSIENGGKIQRPAEETIHVQKGQGHILVVDDEEIVSVSVKEMLKMLGYTVTVFNNGREAIGFYRDNWQSVDLVLLDMVMPLMSGKDTFIALKRINPHIITLLASGYSISGEAQSILDMGVRGFIQKPFTSGELYGNISSLLEKRA